MPGKVLLPIAAGLILVLWLVWIDQPAGPRKTSALAHAIGGTLAGWALVEALCRRFRDWLSVALLALAMVIVLTIVWEFGEYAGDRLLDTALVPRLGDSLEDIFFGTAGGLLGITFASLYQRSGRRGSNPY